MKKRLVVGSLYKPRWGGQVALDKVVPVESTDPLGEPCFRVGSVRIQDDEPLLYLGFKGEELWEHDGLPHVPGRHMFLSTTYGVVGTRESDYNVKMRNLLVILKEIDIEHDDGDDEVDTG